MISFELTENQLLAQSMVQSASRDIFRNHARRIDDEARLDDELTSKLWELGIVQAQVDGGRDSLINAIVLEELGWADASIALGVAGTMGFVQTLLDQGTPEQKELMTEFSGNQPNFGAIGLTEPGFDFDVTDLQTTASRTNSGYRLEGTKAFVPMGSHCSHFLIIAREDGRDQAFIVTASAPGVSVEQTSVMGLKGLGLARVKLESVEVSHDARLGGEDGCDVQRIIDSARVGMGAVLLGVSRAAYEYATAYTRERVAHGTELARKQSVGFRIADMHVAIESLRWMTWRAALDLANGSPDATRNARLAHVYATSQAGWITDEGVQLLGGHGYLKDHPVELWYRNAKTLAVLEGLAGV